MNNSLNTDIAEISVEITQRCPCLCMHCSSNSRPEYETDLDEDILLALADSVSLLGIDRVCISGGEPFLHKSFFNLIDKLCENKVRCVVYSSGMIINEYGRIAAIPIENYMKLSGKVEAIVFNLASTDNSKCDTIMGTHGHLSLLQESIRRSRNAGLRCEAHFVPNRINICSPSALLAFCDRMSLSQINIIRLFPHGRGETNISALMMENDEILSFLRDLDSIKHMYATNVRIGSSLRCENGCKAGTSKLLITPQGIVLPCETFKHSRIKGFDVEDFPSIYEASLEKIVIESRSLNAVKKIASKAADCLAITDWSAA